MCIESSEIDRGDDKILRENTLCLFTMKRISTTSMHISVESPNALLVSNYTEIHVTLLLQNHTATYVLYSHSDHGDNTCQN